MIVIIKGPAGSRALVTLSSDIEHLDESQLEDGEKIVCAVDKDDLDPLVRDGLDYIDYLMVQSLGDASNSLSALFTKVLNSRIRR